MEDKYKSIQVEYTAEFKDRASKFLAYLFPIENEDDFQNRLDEIKSEHHKANHHCFAYRLKDETIFRYNDDGEPSGTAGKPIFNQLVSAELKDCACIVVRYFGGTKLGTSGLINAYKEACKWAIEKADIIEMFITAEIKLSFDYAIMGQLMDVLKSLDFRISEKDFGLKPNVKIEVRISELHSARTQILSKLLNRPIEDINEDSSFPGLRFEDANSV